LRRGTHSDKKLVVDILVTAFEPLQEDNSINFIVRNDGKRLQRLHHFMGYLFDRAILYGDVFISDQENACILFNYPHKIKPSLRSFLLDFKLAVNCIGIKRLFKVLKRKAISDNYFPKGDHIRIIIGGSNSTSGNGAAARLMLEIVKEFKDYKLPVITDASNPDNVRLYKKLGFKEIGVDESLGYPIYFLRMH